MRAEVARQRINPDALDGFCVAMERVELTAALRVAEVLPVGGFVASTAEAGFLNEGFQQNRTIRVAGVPVLGQASADQSKHTRGEILAVDPWQDEEGGIVADEVQISSALLKGPTDHLIARFGFPGACAEAEYGDDL